MYANNEVGTIQPIAEIGALAHRHGILFHTDAVQAGGSLPMNVDALNVDLLSLSAHKFYGPKGVGVLYVRSGVTLDPLLDGGGQEHSVRAGTENVPGIVGLAAALTRAYAGIDVEGPRVTALRDRLIRGVQARIPEAYLQGHPTERLPNNAAFLIAGVSGEDLLLRLDLAGICASSGSACNSGSTAPSHVLTACGAPPISPVDRCASPWASRTPKTTWTTPSPRWRRSSPICAPAVRYPRRSPPRWPPTSGRRRAGLAHRERPLLTLSVRGW